MATSEPQPPGQGENLSVNDVKKIIEEAKMAAVDPITFGLQIFSSLGERATLSGPTLQASLAASGVAVAGPLEMLLSAIQDITKNGGLVTVTTSQEVVTTVKGVRVRLKKEVMLHLFEENGLPGFNNITGISAHELVWLDIHTIQLKQNQGQKVLRVVTPEGAKDFVLK